MSLEGEAGLIVAFDDFDGTPHARRRREVGEKEEVRCIASTLKNSHK